MESYEEELEGYIAAKNNIPPSTLPESRILYSELCGENVLQPTNAQHKSKQLPEGFEVSADPQYAHNQRTGMWLDLNTGDLSYYDQDTQTYIPIQQQTSETESREFQGMIRLVVITSRSWPVGNVVDVNIDEGGLAIGRDRLQDRTMHQLRIPEIEVSRYHARIYVGLDDKTDRATTKLEHKSPPPSAGSEDGEIEAESTEGLSGGECRMPDDGMDDHNLKLQSCGQPSIYIVDQGSTHGTFVNGARLSDARITSKPRRLSHLDQIELGSTKLELHIHEQWACAKCHNSGHNEITTLLHGDDGAIQAQNNPREERTISQIPSARHNDISQERIENLNIIKRRYLPPQKDGSKKEATSQYTDRAKLRRQLQGKSHHTSGSGIVDPQQRNALAPETDTGVKQKYSTDGALIEQSNKGFSLLQKIGWVPGSGLGADESGIVNPIEVTANESRAGLGAPSDHGHESRQRKAARITRERFSQE
ncbi:hypothetical protein GGI23_004440 [Coemansia sp. RSA 2559]|nr:hypothetical protein GGI23_004440 [Coemansia sp. RSA 2559]